MSYAKLTPPRTGDVIEVSDGHVRAPDNPIIPFIEGDGIGPDIWHASQRVVDAAVEKAYGGERKIEWFETYAGEKAKDIYDEWLPEDTFQAFRDFKVGIKGPLTTPVGGGIRSLNVTMRHVLDLYACVRPVRWIEGTPSPVKHPDKLDVVIFRENTEDVYAGIEYERGSADALKLIDFLNTEYHTTLTEDTGIGVKPISEFGTKRFVRKTMEYAIEHGRMDVTLVHKGNIMKYTEGAFRDWAYQVCAQEYGEQSITEHEVWESHDGQVPEGKVLVKDRIADAMFQQILLRPDEYNILCTPNLNGDYLSDAAAAQVGGLGMAPGGNLGDEIACFEATHGTAPKYAGMDKVNPGSLILSGKMMLRHMEWLEASDLVVKGIERALHKKLVTYDLERQMEGATLLKCSEFATAIIENMD